MKTLIYCTKAKPYLYKSQDNGNTFKNFTKKVRDLLGDNEGRNKLNGKVVASFELNLIEQLRWNNDLDVVFTRFESKKSILEKSCLTFEQLCDYVGNKEAYAWHIDKLNVFDKPIELGELVSYKNYREFMKSIQPTGHSTKNLLSQYALTKAPQSYQYVYWKGEKCLLLSVRPQHCYNILQCKKTVEIRKSVPKEVR